MTGRIVWLIARRELNTKLRTRGFVISTVVSIVVLGAFVLMQSSFSSAASTTVVGLNGQAISVAQPLTAEAGRFGLRVETREITDLAAGTAMVADGDLDALVSGPPAGLRVLVDEELDENLRNALDAIVAQQVLESELAAVEDLDAGTVLDRIASAHVDVQTVRTPDPDRGQRVAVAVLIIVLLYTSLVLYGTMLAQGVIEEKSSRVVEILLSAVRPWQLLAGKIVGLGLVGLIQFAVISLAGLLLATATGALTMSGVATGSLLWGLLWYLLGYFLYATVFAAVGSLVSRQEDSQAVLTPITLMLVLAFVLGISVMTQDPAGTAATVLSLLPPFSPILMPGRIALGAATGWEVAASIVLTTSAIALLTLLGARIYRNAILHMGTRVRLRDALR